MDNVLWKKFLNESADMLNEAVDNASGLIPEIEKIIKKYFPKSYMSIKFSTSITNSIWIRFALGTEKDWPSGYFENDIVSARMVIWGFEKDGSFPSGKLQYEPTNTGFVIKPGPGSYNAYDRVKVPSRKKTGTPEQILKSIDKYFSDLKKSLRAHKGDIAPGHEYALKKI